MNLANLGSQGFLTIIEQGITGIRSRPKADTQDLVLTLYELPKSSHSAYCSTENCCKLMQARSV